MGLCSPASRGWSQSPLLHNHHPWSGSELGTLRTEPALEVRGGLTPRRPQCSFLETTHQTASEQLGTISGALNAFVSSVKDMFQILLRMFEFSDGFFAHLLIQTRKGLLVIQNSGVQARPLSFGFCAPYQSLLWDWGVGGIFLGSNL